MGTATLSAGKASFASTFNSAGTETLKAVYAGDTTYSTSTSSSVSVTVSGLTACTATLEGEEGAYFVDDSATGYDRSNILSNIDGSNTQTGVPFSLTLYVYDAKNAARRCRACGWISGSATRLESTRREFGVDHRPELAARIPAHRLQRQSAVHHHHSGLVLGP